MVHPVLGWGKKKKKEKENTHTDIIPTISEIDVTVLTISYSYWKRCYSLKDALHSISKAIQSLRAHLW